MLLKKRAIRKLGAAVALCTLAAACTQPGPQVPTPEPTPTTVSPTPTETQLERQTRLDFEAAEKAYRDFRAEYERVAQAGGLDKPTQAMSENAAGPYLEVMTYFLQQTKAAGKKQVGHLKIAYVRDGPYSPQQLNLEVCEDGRAVKNVAKNGKVSKGIAAEVVLYVRRVNGQWKIWDGDDKKVTSCAN